MNTDILQVMEGKVARPIMGRIDFMGRNHKIPAFVYTSHQALALPLPPIYLESSYDIRFTKKWRNHSGT